jgi:hypothetical protein
VQTLIVDGPLQSNGPTPKKNPPVYYFQNRVLCGQINKVTCLPATQLYPKVVQEYRGNLESCGEMKTIQPGHIILFKDKLTKSPSSETRYNQIGIFVTEKNILFRRKRKIISINMDQLKGTEVLIVAPSQPEVVPKIAKFFNTAKGNYRLFNMGLNILKLERFGVFCSWENIMPTFNNDLTDEEYEKAWDRVTSKLRKYDQIFTFNSKSFISKTIAWIDKGSWSHCGVYSGNHEIFEVTWKGMFTRNLDIYKKKYIHLGVYRRPDFPEEKLDYIDEYKKLNSYYGFYPFHKALVLGIRTLLGFTDGKCSPHDLTPNGLIYTGSLNLVDYV